MHQVQFVGLRVIFGSSGVTRACSTFLLKIELNLALADHFACFDFKIGTLSLDREDLARWLPVGGNRHLHFHFALTAEAALSGVEVALGCLYQIKGLAIFMKKAKLHLIELHKTRIFDLPVVFGPKFGYGARAFRGSVNEALGFGIKSAWQGLWWRGSIPFLQRKLLLVAIPDQAGDPKDDGKQEVRCCSAHLGNFSLTGLFLRSEVPLSRAGGENPLA